MNDDTHQTWVRITVPLSQAEYFALRNAAEADYRDMKNQARYLLRVQLGLQHGATPATTKEDVAAISSPISKGNKIDL